MPVKSAETAFPVFRVKFAPCPDALHFGRPTPQFPSLRFGQPLFVTQFLAGLPAARPRAESLVVAIAWIGGEYFFAK